MSAGLVIVGRRARASPRGVDCGVDSDRCPAVFGSQLAGQIARSVQVLEQRAGLESLTIAA
jgi:hypothetical protein